MRKSCETNFFAVTGAAAVGTVIGLLAGLMLAPKSGNEFRDELVSTGRDLVKKAKVKKDDFMDEMSSQVEDVEDYVNEKIK